MNCNTKSTGIFLIPSDGRKKRWIINAIENRNIERIKEYIRNGKIIILK